MEGLDHYIRDGFSGQRMVVLSPEVFVPYIRHPLIQRMYLTDVGYFPHAQRHGCERREGVAEYILLFCTDGQGSVTLDGHTYTLRQNEAFCIPSHVGHRYGASEENPWSILWVHFAGSDTELFPLRDKRVIRFESAHALDRLASLFNLLFSTLDGSYTEGNFIYVSQVLMMILAEAYYREKKGAASEQNRHVTAIIRYMHAHLDRRIPLSELCDRFSLSKSYINMVFQHYSGHSPMAFFTELKMRRACDLLCSSTLSVTEIARQLGYADPLYFSRAFGKTVGVSPTIYRTRQGGEAPRANDLEPVCD